MRSDIQEIKKEGVSRLQVQNALRILTRVMRPEEGIRFRGGDLVSILKKGEVNAVFDRTQDAADKIMLNED